MQVNIRKTKNKTTVSLLIVFLLCFILVLVRWMNIFNENVFVITEVINSHITNFTISLMACTLVGYLVLCYKKTYAYVVLFGVVLILSNIIYETILPFINK